MGRGAEAVQLQASPVRGRSAAARTDAEREKLQVFGVPFLFAILGDNPVSMSNIRFELREIIKEAGGEVPEWLNE